MRTRLLLMCAVALLFVFSLLAVGCESVEPLISTSASVDISVQGDQALLGKWTQTSPADGLGSTFEFFAEGSVVQVAGSNVWNYTYKTANGQLVFTDSQGVEQAGSTYSVSGNTLTMINNYSGTVYTYQRGGGTTDQALLGKWTQTSPADGLGSTFEFFAEGSVVQVAGSNVWNYTYKTANGQLVFTDSQGVEQAGSTYSVSGNTLTMINNYSGTVYTYQRGGSTSGSSTSQLDSALLGKWTLWEDQDNIAGMEFRSDGTMVDTVWDSNALKYVEVNYTYATAGGELTFTNSQGVDLLPSKYSVSGGKLKITDARSGVVTTYYPQ